MGFSCWNQFSIFKGVYQRQEPLLLTLSNTDFKLTNSSGNICAFYAIFIGIIFIFRKDDRSLVEHSVK